MMSGHEPHHGIVFGSDRPTASIEDAVAIGGAALIMVMLL
jgi:uncharacterized membrane protein